ncbi:MAG: tetratricopeptide repeat protein, partial [Halieaceae bacterium]|nr:tetratricopeptide repeat protein [Halieaceae bacterium]
MTPIIEQILQQGLDAHQIGDFALAQASYEQILCSTPRQPETNHALGLLMMSTNQFSPAADCLKRALDAKPDDQSLWINYLDALISAKRFDEAGKVAEEARLWGIPPQELDAREFSILQACIEHNIAGSRPFELESSEVISGQPLATEDALQAVDLISAEATNAPPEQQIEALVRCYEGSDFSGAEVIARKILKNFPSHVLAWSVLSVITVAEGRITEALEASHELVALSPSDARAHYNLGNAYRLANELEKAEISYHQAISLEPLSAEAHNNLGIVLQSMKRLAEAEACFSESLAINPAHFEAKYNMGAVLLELGRLSEAEKCYRGAIDLKPDLDRAYGNLGVVLKRMGRLNEAADNFKLAIALRSDYPEAHFNLGLTLEDLGSLTDAQEMFGRALSLQPNYPMAQAHLNHIRQRLADFSVYSALAEDSAMLGVATEAAPPWVALTWSDDPGQQLLRAKRYAAEFHGGPER